MTKPDILMLMADQLTSTDGLTFAAARAHMSERSREFLPHDHFTGFIEMHIEQGPNLDCSEDRIGVVSNIVGIREARVEIRGRQNHAGTTPMHLRQDAFQALMDFNQHINRRFETLASANTVWTLGHVELSPNASSVVPGVARFTLQWRDGDMGRLEAMGETLRDVAARVAQERSVTIEVAPVAGIDPSNMDAAITQALRSAAQELAPGQWRDMPSGALHDAANVSRVMPAAMLFVPSIGGISHAFDEDTEEADLVLGLEVLNRAAQSLA